MAGPTGGQVTAGGGSISQSGGTTTVKQTTQTLSLNWNTFNIAPTETVNFVQPTTTSIAVNRILDTNGSQILGHLNANGQVYLVNPNGIVFGQGSEVNVGGLVASTLNIDDASLSGNLRHFSGSGTGSIVNLGTIHAADGGTVAFLANHVSNQGTIVARLGSVALAAGNAVTLTFSGNSLVHLQVDQSTLNNLAENGGLIQADGGYVIMNAGAKDALLASVVNNSGIIQAQTVDSHAGTITLLGGMAAGSMQVGGTLDASAPQGGNGGAIETSAAHVDIANGTRITTAAAQGQAGSWLIDPVVHDFTIAASGGDISGATLSANLGSGSVTILSSSGTSTTNGAGGNINVDDTVAWSANTLTLSAQNNININSAMNATGTAGLVLQYGQASTAGTGSSYNVNAPVNLAATSAFSTQMGSSGTLVHYTVIDSLGAATDATTAPTTASLQGMAATANLAGNYVLGSNLDATATSTWNSGAGFTPIGNSTTAYSGTFDGLGHTIANLTINTPTVNYVGLFGETSAASTIRNVGLTGGSVSGSSYVGGLVGNNYGMVSNAYATDSVNGGNYYAGGLVGRNVGTISNSYVNGATRGPTNVGGLVGLNTGTIQNSYSLGTVYGSNRLGGLVGVNTSTIADSYSITSVTSDQNQQNLFGGLVGDNSGSITNSYANGVMTVNPNQAGGLLGANYGNVSTSYWNTGVYASGIGAGTLTGATGLTSTQMQTASNFAGFGFTTTPGATGNNWVMVDADGSLNNAGGVTGATRPMLASEYSATINNAHQLQLMEMALTAGYTLGANINAAATGNSTDTWGSSGFVPIGNANVTARFSGTFDGLGHIISNITINTPMVGFVGLFGVTNAASMIRNVGLTGGSVSGSSYVGGLVGYNFGTISNTYATGSVTGSSNYVGGLVGVNYGTISNAYATGSVTGSSTVGGLVGNNPGTISNAYATGSVTGSSAVGGLVGNNVGTISNAFWNSSVNSTGVGGTLTGATGLSTALLQTSAPFLNAGWSMYGTSKIWGQAAGAAPTLCAFTAGACTTALTANPGGTSVYGGNISPTVQLDQGLLSVSTLTAMGVGLTGTATLTGVGSNAGSYTATYTGGMTLSGSNAADFTLTNGSGTYVITPAALTITANNAAKTYGTALPTLGVSYSGFVNNDTAASLTTQATASTAATAASNAGSYAIAASGAADGNYSYSYVNGNLTVNPALLTVTANNAAKTYGAALPTLGVSYSGFVNGDMVSSLTSQATASTAATAASNAGNYAITASGAVDGNYSYSYVNGNLTVNPALLTVTANNASKTYGAALPTLGVSYSGFVNGDMVSSLTSQAMASTAATAASNAGTYAITASGAVDGNYSYSYVNGSLTVNPALLIVTANNASKTYGAALPTLGVSYSGFVNGVMVSSLTSQAMASTAATAASNAGTYAIAASGAADGNYTYSYANGNLIINPAQLTVTATPVSRLFGAANPAFSGSVTGFVNGDTLASATTGTETYRSPATLASPGGHYAIDGTGLAADHGNYTFAQAAGNAAALTIDTAPAATHNAVANIESNITAFNEFDQTPSQIHISTTLNDESTTYLSNALDFNNVITTIGSTQGQLRIINGGVKLPE
ncbi:MAG: beta strand repeat-containing protein [Burkholderiales bacterium]